LRVRACREPGRAQTERAGQAHMMKVVRGLTDQRRLRCFEPFFFSSFFEAACDGGTFPRGTRTRKSAPYKSPVGRICCRRTTACPPPPAGARRKIRRRLSPRRCQRLSAVLKSNGHIPTRGAGTAWRLLSGVPDVPPSRAHVGVGLHRPPPAPPPAWHRAAVVMASGYFSVMKNGCDLLSPSV